MSGTVAAEPKLAIFLPMLGGGGAERAMVELANGIAAAGHRIDLVLGSATGPFVREVSPDVAVVDLQQRRVARALPALAAYLRQERPAALLSATNHANVAALLARGLSGTRTRIVLSQQMSLAGYRHGFRGIRHRLVRLAMRLSYRGAEMVTTVAEEMVAEAIFGLGLHPARVRSIPNPLVSDRLQALAQATPPHPWMRGQFPVVLGAGRLAPEKDFATLIRAFSRLDGDARLIILGEGPERAKLEHLIGELGLQHRVSLPGFDANPFAYMKRSRLFVLSSLCEGLPGVLVQAMACGCPVVATDCRTGPGEILCGGRWGHLVPVGDVVELAEAMRSSLARHAHPDVAKRAADYSVDAAVGKYLAVLLN